MVPCIPYFLLTDNCVISSQHSDYCHVSSGCTPRLAIYILGLLLFTSYVNNILSVVRSKVKVFADNVTLFTAVKCNDD